VSRRRLLFPVILLVALAVRLWGLGFGLPYIIARPDETEIAGPAVGFLSGDLRPPFFEWPTLFTYTAAFFYVMYFLVTRPFTGYATLAAFAESRRQSIAPFLYITRALSAVTGVLTVWWVHSICRRLFDQTTAIVACLFLALAFLHVRDSHFGVTDVAMTALVTLTVLLILKWRQTGNFSDAALAGFVGGLAGSTKYNGLGVCMPFIVALVQRVGNDGVRRLALALMLFGATMALGFFGASPYILIDWPRFVHSISGVGAHLAEGHGLMLGRGWSYYARVILPAAVGWPMFLAGLAGLVVLMATRLRDAAVLFAFPIAYYVIAGRGYTVFARYVIPVLPFLCIAAAWFVVYSVGRVAKNAAPSVRDALVAAAAIAVVAPTALQTLALDRLLGTTDNRVLVGRALVDIVTNDTSFYQSGEKYGYVPTKIDGREIAHIRNYNAATGQFEPNEPDWILLQRSPLILYSGVPPRLEQLVRERYTLVQRFPAGGEQTDALYDQQDAFYLPLQGLSGITRPGPAFELYRKNASQ
jgi:hypothetical protein